MMSMSKDKYPVDAVRGVTRRAFLRGSAVAVGGVAAAGVLLDAPQAWAQSGLPLIGSEIPCSMLAINTPLQIRTSLVTVDFRGGIKYRVDVDPDDPENSRRLRIIGHKVSAELPDGGGTITIEQNDVDVDPQSRLRLTSRSPIRYENIVHLSFTMVIEQPETLLREAGMSSPRIKEPLVLVTKNPQVLTASLTRFPPQGDLYRQQNPVDLVLPDDPDTTIATIQRFPVKMGGL
jgi:hypothetical protein